MYALGRIDAVNHANKRAGRDKTNTARVMVDLDRILQLRGGGSVVDVIGSAISRDKDECNPWRCLAGRNPHPPIFLCNHSDAEFDHE